MLDGDEIGLILVFDNEDEVEVTFAFNDKYEFFPWHFFVLNRIL